MTLRPYLIDDLINIVYDYARELTYLEEIVWGNIAKYSYVRSTDELYYDGMGGFGIISLPFDKHTRQLEKLHHYRVPLFGTSFVDTFKKVLFSK